MEELPPAGEEEEPWDAMARGALRQLEATRAEADDRQAALQLLAADALLTYAFQCAAEEDGDLRQMAERWGPHGGLGDALSRAQQAADPDGSSGADAANADDGSRVEGGGEDPTREAT